MTNIQEIARQAARKAAIDWATNPLKSPEGAWCRADAVADAVAVAVLREILRDCAPAEPAEKNPVREASQLAREKLWALMAPARKTAAPPPSDVEQAKAAIRMVVANIGEDPATWERDIERPLAAAIDALIAVVRQESADQINRLKTSSQIDRNT